MNSNELRNLSWYERINNQNGKIGYLIAWIMGVPASVLLVIFLIRGH